MGNEMREETAKDVPLSARLRLAAGFRVPSTYQDWAIEQIQSDGWPMRQALTRFLFVGWPSAGIGFAIVNLLVPGPAITMNWIGLLVIFPVTGILVGVIIGGGWPEFFRRRAIKYQQRERNK